MTPSPILLEVARTLSPLLDEVVFVGGQVAPLYFTVSPVATPRPTKDVDIVVSVASRTQLRKLDKRLESLGLRNDMSPGAPICRWLTPDSIPVDVMPTDAALLGFSNRWYAWIVEHPRVHRLAEDLSILIPTAPLYLAAKWEAFLGRGANDPASTDLEDVIMVVAGRPEIVAEVAEAPAEVRSWLGEQARHFLADDQADYALQGALGRTPRAPDLLNAVAQRFRQMVEGGW
ncbi:MAG: hypothetical protein ACODAB_07440 [Gemmatimonadota bacterium]